VPKAVANRAESSRIDVRMGKDNNKDTAARTNRNRKWTLCARVCFRLSSFEIQCVAFCRSRAGKTHCKVVGVYGRVYMWVFHCPEQLFVVAAANANLFKVY